MNFPRTYQPDKIFNNKDLFEYLHRIELEQLLPLKSRLKYDTDLTNEDRYELIQSFSLLNDKYIQLTCLLESRLYKTFIN